MKKVFVFVLVLAFFAGMTGLVSAAQNVANTSQKGSLLVFPKIDVSGDRDTIVMISNDYTSAVDVQCYWMDQYQNWEDFSFKLTKKQPVWFSAKSGIGNVGVPPFGSFGEVGELKCWAVNAAQGEQISFNHLWGTAKVIDFRGAFRDGIDIKSLNWFDGWAYEYNSWNFTARGVALGQPVGTAGELVLSGADGAYDGCPQYLLFNIASVGAKWGYPDYWDDGYFFFKNKNTDLTIALCQEDLRQDRDPNYTKLKMTLWNGYEVKYTGAWACAKCWYESYLDYLEGGAWLGWANGSEKFLWESLHTDFAMLRVQAVASTQCPGSVAMGILGLSAEFMDAYYVPFCNDLPAAEAGVMQSENFFGRQVVVGGTTANGAGIYDNGFILWDADDNVTPELR